MKLIRLMEERFQHISQSALDPLTKGQMLLEDCRRYGTISFAHLARAAFIATSMLRSMETVAIATSEQIRSFLASIKTVTSEFERDGGSVSNGSMKWEDFLGIYGHLRPGTYEVTSPSYAEEPEQYLRPMIDVMPQAQRAQTSSSTWDANTRSRLAESLGSLGLDCDVDAFERFMRQAIEGRESSKFAFSRNLSVALDQLRAFGESVGISRDQLSFIGIQDLLTLSNDSPVRDVRSWLTERAEEGERWYRTARAIELPPLLVRACDFTAFERPQSQPNFVTNKTVVAKSIDLTDSKTVPAGLEGTIVLIPEADPGFDWLFGQSIAGLVTMYGGANSHMTVRAAEFGLPAAIGVGESLYERLSDAQIIELDCANQWLSVVR
ncbi:MAG: hypothetical protein IIC24_12015 [Chloroflexi bacterium]|nr:hypothetical protein [Chloroflexota bacterium]